MPFANGEVPNEDVPVEKEVGWEVCVPFTASPVGPGSFFARSGFTQVLFPNNAGADGELATPALPNPPIPFPFPKADPSPDPDPDPNPEPNPLAAPFREKPGAAADFSAGAAPDRAPEATAEAPNALGAPNTDDPFPNTDGLKADVAPFISNVPAFSPPTVVLGGEFEGGAAVTSEGGPN